MIIYEGIGGLVLFLAMAVLSIYFYGRLCRDAGYEEGRADQYTALGADQAGERTEHAGRHRAGQPRAFPAGHPQDWSSPPLKLNPGVALAVPIGTALLAPSPAPALNGAADTGTMPRVKLPDATTGAIRAVGDELVAKIERGELVP